MKIIFIILLIILTLFELCILVVVFFMSDEVTCNWIWCTFKTTISSSTYSQTCYVNDEQVNCSEITGGFNES